MPSSAGAAAAAGGAGFGAGAGCGAGLADERRDPALCATFAAALLGGTGAVTLDAAALGALLGMLGAFTLTTFALTTFTVTAPSDVARDYDIGSASFGPSINTTALSGKIVAAADPAESTGTTTDGCSAITNASDLRGNIALIDRGGCTFVTKALNAQAAGASGVIIVDNSKDTCMPPGLGGDDATVRIPVFSMGINDGAKIRTALGSNSVNGMLRVDPSVKAGVSGRGFVRLYAPCTLVGGSSVHHWDVSATPNLLMEPFISDDLKPGDVDITVQQLMDIGWSANVGVETSPTPSGRRNLKRGK